MKIVCLTPSECSFIIYTIKYLIIIFRELAREQNLEAEAIAYFTAIQQGLLDQMRSSLIYYVSKYIPLALTLLSLGMAIAMVK